MGDDLKILNYKRGIIKGNLTRSKNYFEGIKSQEIVDEILEQIKARIGEAENLIFNFNSLQEEIDILSLSKEPSEGVSSEDHENYIASQSNLARETFEKDYHNIISQTRIFIVKNSPDKSDSDSQSQNSQRVGVVPSITPNTVSNVNFSKINLPVFSGNYHEWMEFHDIFQSLIDKNVNLDAVQKFYYLKSCLRSEAANVI